MNEDLQTKYDKLKEEVIYLKRQLTLPMVSMALALENHIDLGKHQSMAREDRIAWEGFLITRKNDLTEAIKQL